MTVIGIDLGTTNSCVAVRDGDQTIVIPNAEGARTTPSVVAFAQSDERLVGQIAKRQAATNPQNTIFAIKRLMGAKFESPQIQDLIPTCPYEILKAPNGDAFVSAHGKQYSPPEISSMILSMMKETAESYLGTTIEQAVITVPAYFDDVQRQATKDAGRIAGLDVLRIVNEPTAAALAYGMENDSSGLVAVYDLGGGTFDISILQMAGGVFQVKATSGDTFLGGEDFDQAIVKWLFDQANEKHDLNLRGDKMALQRLKEAAEKAKHELSSATSTEINLPFIGAGADGPVHLQLELSRGQLETMTRSLIERTLEPCRQALADCGVSTSDIDAVLLVGGQTRMPRVQEIVTEFFGREPHRGMNPDEVVAVGASIQAGVLTGAVEDVLLLDVTPLSLGVETAGGIFTRIIDKNTTVPHRSTMEFSTSIDNQDFVPIHVLQGEREMAADNKSLTRFELVGIPPAPRGVPRIEVAFDLDANGILTVSATDLGTQKEQKIEITPTTGLTEDDIERLVSEASTSKEKDAARKEVAEAKNRVQSLLYTAKRALEEYGEILGPNEQEDLSLEIESSEELLKSSEDLDEIQDSAARLELAAQRIGDILYTESLKQTK